MSDFTLLEPQQDAFDNPGEEPLRELDATIFEDTIIVDDDGNGDFITLAAAISAAKSGDTITVTGGADNLHTEADIRVYRSLTIQGDGRATVDANRAGRVFIIDDRDENTLNQVFIDGLTISGGVANLSRNTEGGGIYNAEDLNIRNSTIINNEGDGIYHAPYSAPLIVSNSTVSDNNGNGITIGFFQSSTISNSTISGNSGRGLKLGDFGDNTISNSTISGNNGGGIYNGGTTDILNSTITGNTSLASDAGYTVGLGGGIYNGYNASIGLDSTIVANNIAREGTDNISNANGISGGSSLVAANSLIESNGDQIDVDRGRNIIGQDPLLDPRGLRDNGGPTKTIALLAGSPAINQGNASNSGSTDQRGEGFNRVVGGAADIGAFEVQEAAPPPPTTNLVVGTLGDNVLYGSDGKDTILGLAGDDRLIGKAGDDTLKGARGNDQLNGGEGDDKLFGGNGNDRLRGGEGRDRLLGGAGYDRLIGGAGADILDGGEGLFDAVDYRKSSAGVRVDLRSNKAANGGDAKGDTLTNIENISGSNFADKLSGDAGNNILFGFDGDDILVGRRGADQLIGGAGADVLSGGVGKDRFTLRDFSESLLSGYDTITDFAIGTDRLKGPIKVAAGDVRELGAVASLEASSIAAVLNRTQFVSQGAAVFTVGSSSFLALNDSTAGFQARQDALIEITGFTGAVTDLAIT